MKHIIRQIGKVAAVGLLLALVVALAPEPRAFAQTTDQTVGGTTATTQDPSTGATTDEGTTTDDGSNTTTPDTTTTTTEEPPGGVSTDSTTQELPAPGEGTLEQPLAEELAVPIPVPPSVVNAILAQIAALGDQATPAERELAALLTAGEIESITALADYLVENDSLALLSLVSDTLLDSGDTTAAQAIIPQLLDAGLTDSAVSVVQAVIAEGEVASLLPLLPAVVDALAAAGETEQIAAIVTQLLTPETLQTLLADPANTALLTAVLQAVVEAGQADLLAGLVPGLVDDLLAAGQLQQAVALITALADSGALAELPGLLTQIVTPELVLALLADPANAPLLTSLFETLVDAGQVGVLANLVPGLVNDLLAAGQLQQVVTLITALADSGALAELPGLVTQIVTPELVLALLADPANAPLLTALFEALVDAGQVGVLANMVPGLVNQLLAAGELEQVVALITALADSGALVLVPGLLTQLLTPELFDALLANPANLQMVVDLLSSVVQALVDAAGQFGIIANLLPTLTSDLQDVVDLIESLVALVQPLAGPVITVVGPVADSVSVESLITPVISSSLASMSLTAAPLGY